MLKFATILVGGLSAMGGWAVVTVMDVPEYFVAGQQYTIEFQVRQHGRTLLNGLQPELLVGAGSGRKETIPAVPRPATGTYAATFTAPSTGPLLLTIKSGLGSTPTAGECCSSPRGARSVMRAWMRATTTIISKSDRTWTGGASRANTSSRRSRIQHRRSCPILD